MTGLPGHSVTACSKVLVSVDAPHFNAGLILEDGVCVQAAPILKWAIGKTRAQLRAYFKQKGWKAMVVK
jgi:hypothetical protein